MSKFRESLIDRMITLYGFEYPTVIRFASLCEYWQGEDRVLRLIVEAHEGNPGYWCDEEEEEE